MATSILKEDFLSFTSLLSQKGRLSAQPKSSLGISNLGFRVLMCAVAGTAIFLSSQLSVTLGHNLLCLSLELSLE